MGLRVFQCKRQRMGGDLTDQAFADTQARLVHGVLAQALRGEQFQHVARTPEINRANFRDHFQGDDANDLIQPFLGRRRRSHDLADLAQHAAGDGRNHPTARRPSVAAGLAFRLVL